MRGLQEYDNCRMKILIMKEKLFGGSEERTATSKCKYREVKIGVRRRGELA